MNNLVKLCPVKIRQRELNTTFGEFIHQYDYFYKKLMIE